MLTTESQENETTWEDVAKTMISAQLEFNGRIVEQLGNLTDGLVKANRVIEVLAERVERLEA
jgi:hypothetical protein